MTSATTKSTSLAPNYEYHTSTPQSLHIKYKMQVCTAPRNINILAKNPVPKDPYSENNRSVVPFSISWWKYSYISSTARWRRQGNTHGLVLDGKSNLLEWAVTQVSCEPRPHPPFRFKDNQSLDVLLVHLHYFCVQWVKPCPDRFPEPRDSLLSTTDDTVVPMGKVYAIGYGWQACTHERQQKLQQQGHVSGKKPNDRTANETHTLFLGHKEYVLAQ